MNNNDNKKLLRRLVKPSYNKPTYGWTMQTGFGQRALNKLQTKTIAAIRAAKTQAQVHALENAFVKNLRTIQAKEKQNMENFHKVLMEHRARVRAAARQANAQRKHSEAFAVAYRGRRTPAKSASPRPRIPRSLSLSARADRAFGTLVRNLMAEMKKSSVR